MKTFFASPERVPFTAATGTHSFRESGPAGLAALQPDVEATRGRMAESR